MTIWIDAQLSPSIALWIAQNFPVQAVALRDLGLRDAEDEVIFTLAKAAGAVIMTKDWDFLGLLDRQGAPPQILWGSCGNTSNARLKQILAPVLPTALELLGSGEKLVEIRDANPQMEMIR